MKRNRIWAHIIFWLAYVLYESYLEFAWISKSFASTPPFSRWVMALKGESSLLLIKVPLVYFILYLVNDLAPRLKRPGLVFIPGFIAVGFSVIAHRLLIVRVVLPHLYHEPLDNSLLFNVQRVLSTFIDIVFVVVVAIAIKQYRLYQQSREKEKGLVKEKLEAELKFLRNQTNPHFLFNTLNNIYALARKKSDDTADVVMKLSKLLRFMLYESRNATITIADELRVLDDYIELEKIRYNERLNVQFTRSIDNESQPIAPLILLPFVENAFKHGASEARFNSFINIEVQLHEGQLTFRVGNSKDDDGENAVTENIGLSNVRRQLELMYPQHYLEIENGKTCFKVTLTINLLIHATVPLSHR